MPNSSPGVAAAVAADQQNTATVGHELALSAKEARLSRGLSQTEAAAVASVSPNSWRAFEINEASVSPKIRARCRQAVAKILARAEAA